MQQPQGACPPCAWLALAGPTASGKTALALALARRWPLEIISVDSALVYRGLDIGTAKPSAAERAAVVHHLIDIRDPTQPYSAAEFVRDATTLIGAIHARGRWPLLVGGTMLYFKALFDGLDDLPAAQPTLRAAIEAEARARGWPALHAELAQVDPVTAARLAPHDAQRIGRALEVWRATGQPLSALQRRWPAAPPLAQPPRPDRDASVQPAPLRIGRWPGRLLSLEPADRGWLRARIDARLRAMWRDGLLDEVRHLRARGDLGLHLPALRCVGYRQAWEALEEAQASGRTALTAQEQDQLHERAAAATRQLAKRQLTWLRAMPQRRVLPADAEDALLSEVEREAQAAWGPPGRAPTAADLPLAT
ncbi:MAG: tRNA (adenosine(37)-N6)-dimethylallyltransferase MiaA [Tepidimonas sp.]|uniref:tRNA (adenosine(37)-N6)-dimethylallyltransferase MiaA n=1 Tax=Tepidimonas sp. TaxID=2002775 RepID=UPI00298F1653|nr:tRNA (adenosine(37)-N6)-dimethylallyltransferase MiaA [Tepidimonas sp.]MDW8336389.1 tRNA (adenosine(37)-N6)-dimethylallyltransferase MiaA [Tepidimonas sp.]